MSPFFHRGPRTEQHKLERLVKVLTLLKSQGSSARQWPSFRIVPFAGAPIDFGVAPFDFQVVVRDQAGLDALTSLDALAMTEGYMSEHLDFEGDLILAARYLGAFGDNHPWIKVWRRLQPLLLGRERLNPSWIALHYDAAHAQLFAADREYHTYTPGVYRSDEDTLEVGAERKLSEAFERLGLQRGDHLLEVGCGWGGMTRFAARRGVKVTGITLSRDQKAYVDELVAKEKLDAQVFYQDFFTFDPGHRFDAVSMMGVIEDLSDYRRTLRCVEKLIKPGGRFFLDFAAERSRFATHSFVTQHIWPGTFRMVYMPELVDAIRESPFELMWLDNDRYNYHRCCELLYQRWQEARPQVEAKHGARVWRMFNLLYAGVSAMMDRPNHRSTAYRVLLEYPADHDGVWWTTRGKWLEDRARGALGAIRDTALWAWESARDRVQPARGAATHEATPPAAVTPSRRPVSSASNGALRVDA